MHAARMTTGVIYVAFGAVSPFLVSGWLGLIQMVLLIGLGATLIYREAAR
jgi:hypothetical protein